MKSSLYHRNMGENAGFRLAKAAYSAAKERWESASRRYDRLEDAGHSEDNLIVISDHESTRRRNMERAWEYFLHIANGRGIRVTR
mgnify:CR=1 FL=1